ncbi:Hypothetical protein PHPALM_38059, partial [Phytophthora palmivora]
MNLCLWSVLVLGIRGLPPFPAEPEGPAQFKLNFGERYGWWAHHDEKENKQQVATVHGAVNDFRTQILLDTGATVSMISLDLALLYGAKSWAVAVKVVNISDKDLWIDSSTPVARIVEYGCFPRAGRFVRPGVRRYQEWQHLIYESTLSTQARMRKGRYEQALRDTTPPSVPKRSYQWPAKLLMRPQAKNDEVRVVRLHKRPMTVISECADGSEPECGSQKGEKPVLPTMDHSSIPLERLEEDYIRCMRVNAEELEQEPAFYIHEGSDMMSQLKDQLAMLPELQDLSPRCDISKAVVGEPGEPGITTDVQERQLKEILKRHRSIFLGDGNVAPAPARGVVCDLDVGDAKPVAQRPRP